MVVKRGLQIGGDWVQVGQRNIISGRRNKFKKSIECCGDYS